MFRLHAIHDYHTKICTIDHIMIFIWTRWGRAMHVCIRKLTIIGSENSLSSSRRQTIIWTNDEILLIGPFETNFSEILIGIHTFSFKKCIWICCLWNGHSFCFSLNVLTHSPQKMAKWAKKIPSTHSGEKCLDFPKYLSFSVSKDLIDYCVSQV